MSPCRQLIKQTAVNYSPSGPHTSDGPPSEHVCSAFFVQLYEIASHNASPCNLCAILLCVCIFLAPTGPLCPPLLPGVMAHLYSFFGWSG